MTDEHDHGEGLAPVTDLFGARSRRGRPRTGGAAGAGAAAGAPDADDGSPLGDAPGTGDTRDTRDVRGVRDTRNSRATAGSGGAADSSGPSVAAQDSWADDGDGHGAPAAAEWLSPVVGDGTGRSARAELDGYDSDTADAAGASVFAIHSGEALDPADAPRPIEEQRADAERLSMRALGRKGVSESEMRQVLTKQDLDPDVVEHEVARLTRVGLLDDVALATDLVDRLHDRKGLGRQGVVAELRRRGIDQAAIEAALDAAADDADDEFVRAIELAEKRAGQMRGLDRATAERRLSGFLMRKGYGSGVVRVAVARALDGGPRRPSPGGGPVRFE